MYKTRKYIWKTGFVLALSVVAAFPAWGQNVVFPRAKSAITLFGFEGPNAITQWNGIPHKATMGCVSEGSQAMSFTFPKYEEGKDKWPLIAIDWNEGKGYATKDWSHHGKLVFDAWTHSKDTSDLGIELHDLSNGNNGWSQHYTIEPGRKNVVQVDLVDTRESLDLTNVKRILFFTSVPKSSYTVTIDNVRLIPGDRKSLADFDMVYPNYRNTVFPAAKDIKLSIALHPEEYGTRVTDLAVKLTAVAGKTHSSKNIPCKADTISTSIPVDNFPAGEIKVTADIVNRSAGKKLFTKSWTLHKLTKAEVSALKTYIDENNNTIIDGKPFFPIGWYDSMNSPYGIDQMVGGPFNCVLNYRTNHQSKKDMIKFLDKVQAMGMKLIYCLNDLYPSSREFKDLSWEGIKGNDKIAAAVVDAYKNHPAILAWYLNDEIPKTLKPELTEYYQRVASMDPNHPCYIVLCNMPEVKYFSDTTDIMGVDPYPIPELPVTRVSDQTDVSVSAVNGHKPSWVVLQAFAWYQHHSSNPDRGHIPTAEELRTGRAPTYEESRCMTYLALTHGAKGIIYWCYYNMKVLPQYKEMRGWMDKIGNEVKTLSPMLLSADDFGEVKYTSSGKVIDTKLKRYNGDLYLMAVNPGSDPCSVTFNIGRKIAQKTEVMFEDRSITSDGVKLTDTFKPLEVHVYKLGK